MQVCVLYAGRTRDGGKLPALAKAVAKGDGEAINGILRQVLSTEEGRRVAQKINEAMK